MGSGRAAPAQERGCAIDGGRAERQNAIRKHIFANHVGADPVGNEGGFDMVDDAAVVGIDSEFPCISYVSGSGFGEQVRGQLVERGPRMAEKSAVATHQMRRHPSRFGVGADAVGRGTERFDTCAILQQRHIVDELPASDEIFLKHTILLVSYSAIMGAC